MAGWMFIYLAVIAGLCYTATASELEGRFACGIVLFIIGFLSMWLIGRIIVNPENRIWSIAMLVCNTAAIIYIVIHMIRNK